MRESAKSIKVRYFVIDVPSSYNTVIKHYAFNILETDISTLYLIIKYLLDNSKIGVVKGDQEMARKYYQDSLKIKKAPMIACHSLKPNPHIKKFIDLYPEKEYTEYRLMPTEDLKEV